MLFLFYKGGNIIFTTAIIVAGGTGSRMNSEIPKQFLKIQNKIILQKTLEVFNDCKQIDEIIVVLHKNQIKYFEDNIKILNKKEIKLVVGGSQRQESSYNALLSVNKKCEIVLIHDGVRPFITQDIILNCIEATKIYNCCITGVLSKDTIKKCNEDGFIVETVDRNNLFCVQTPQAFKFNLIFEAHKKALEDGFLGTDDSVLMERIGYRVKIVDGSYDNIKITTKEDLKIGESL